MEILRADVVDAEEILNLQKLAYRSEAKRYNDYNITPLKQTLPEIIEQFKTNIFLKAVSENKIVGTVRAYEENDTCFIGRLAVVPDRNERIGMRVKPSFFISTDIHHLLKYLLAVC
jgi:hypothetical protein